MPPILLRAPITLLMVVTLLLIVLLSSCLTPIARDFQRSVTPEDKIEEDLRAEMRTRPPFECAGEICKSNVVVLLKDPAALLALQEAAEINGEGSDEVFAQLATYMDEIEQLQDNVLAAVPGFQLDVRYEAVPALVGRASDREIRRLSTLPEVERVGNDIGEGSARQFDSVAMIHADSWHPEGFRGNGIMGKGVKIAVLDSGISTTIPALANAVIHEACFLDFTRRIDDEGKCPNGKRRQFGVDAAKDNEGHGTSVSGILTSDGGPLPMGVAPAAEIISLKVLDQQRKYFKFSEIVAALDYLIVKMQKGKLDVDLINISIGSNTLFEKNCDKTERGSIATATIPITVLRYMGVATFAASGNLNSFFKMEAPGCISQTISVGASDKDDRIVTRTNRSASLDLVAPGMEISMIGLNGRMKTDGGTSFAVPHAVGCAALLIEAGIVETPKQIEAELKASSIRVTDTVNLSLFLPRTFPRVDCIFRESPHAAQE